MEIILDNAGCGTTYKTFKGQQNPPLKVRKRRKILLTVFRTSAAGKKVLLKVFAMEDISI